MFDNLSKKLNSALQVIKGHGKITEINIAESLKEVRRALLDADVSFKIAKDFTLNVKEKALGLIEEQVGLPQFDEHTLEAYANEVE